MFLRFITRLEPEQKARVLDGAIAGLDGAMRQRDCSDITALQLSFQAVEALSSELASVRRIIDLKMPQISIYLPLG